ncbi:MAG: short-chain dehydrogenase [Polyangiaceae bacterium UTPRO1]|jgi:NAD(P)-dependent dehydrogenase (short-subunit alcohol dehydrogenase family)|nr:SDR family NAD(P)-dependent oxidoreductase [Myxococcales bacterium]OQY64897.1 MAG: short-chain dehydrogenase [Polyangiaceae bacterium UTPRO1]
MEAQHVVITGLGQGMGRRAALLLAKRGAAVAGFDVDAEGITSLGRELDALGARHHLRCIDITDRTAIMHFKDAVLARFGHVDTVVSNVGVGFFGPFEELDLDAALKCFEINVIGAAAVFQAFIPSMRERRAGKLVAVSSLVGRIPFPFESIYSATKFALNGMVLSFKYELAPFGIEVALIEPAQVSTGFAAKIHKLPPEGSPYRDRVRRFIVRDNELIASAPDPDRAAAKYVEVILSPRPRVYTQIDFTSRLFLALNNVLPAALRDWILLRHMDIAEAGRRRDAP